MKIGITGQSGFIGSHLYNYLNLFPDVTLIDFEKSFLSDEERLRGFVKQCDTIVHLAAMNRHEDPNIIYDTNVQLVEQLLNACDSEQHYPTILFSSSTQESADNHYGRSKRKGQELLDEWSIKTGSRVISMIIPNVFGPFGKPYYNSVVATFCHQLTHGEEPKIINDGNLRLIYINELIDDIKDLIFGDERGLVRIEHRHELKVSELSEVLGQFRDEYLLNDRIPDINSSIKLALFNTYRCYIDPDHYPRPFIQHTDSRGSFVEIVRAGSSGQYSFSTTVPGITRGEHFHTRKAERFAVIRGKARISLRKIDSDEVIDYILDGDSPSYVDMPIWHTHNITNIGDEVLVCLFWINEPYDASDPDTYFVKVREIEE